MKSWVRCIPAVAVLAMLAGSCGTSTQMAEVWRDPAFKSPAPVTKVMIIGIGESDRRIMSFEDQMGRKFAARKLAVVAGASVIPRDTISRDALVKMIRDTGSQLAITTRLVGMDQEQQYIPGSTYYTPVGGYAFTPYYYSSYAVVSDPGYVVNYKVYKLETNVYDVASEKLVWSGLSKITDPANMADATNSLGNRLISELSAAKIIP